MTGVGGMAVRPKGRLVEGIRGKGESDVAGYEVDGKAAPREPE
jgi:hypothetical protein